MYSSTLPVHQQILYQVYYYATFGLFLAVLAMIVLLSVRHFLHSKEKISIELIDHFNKLILGLSSILFLAFLIELLVAFFQGYLFEQFAFYDKALGKYWMSYFLMIFFILIPQVFWKRKWRRNIKLSWLVALILMVQIWIERITILITTLMRDLQ